MKYCKYKIFSTRVNVQALFSNFKNDRLPFLLESGKGVGDRGRYSFFSSDPFLVLRVKDGRCFQEKDGVITACDSAPLQTLRELLQRYALVGKLQHDIPLLCGAVGFFSYDFGFQLEKMKRRHVPDRDIPDFVFGFYDWVVCVDHLEKKVIVFSSGFPEKGMVRRKRASNRLKQVLKKLENDSLRDSSAGIGVVCGKKDLVSNFSKAAYMKAVEEVKEYISCGDIYQVNLSQRFKTRLAIDDWALYRRLSKRFPVSFSGFFSDGPMSIISASPEMFLSYENQMVLSRPMKGTRPRTVDRAFNRISKQQLIDSAKEKAELLMIVDLERNDLGRVCEYGSVRVNRFRRIESYRGVFQAIAEVKGKLYRKKDRLDLIKACFPGGSVTGAPKIAAMEVIERLEPHPRGAYTGSLGFLSFHDTLEFNILIRSFVKYNDEISFHVGGGIVTDSNPRAEYEETLVKAKALKEALFGI
ncbi:MAG: anthranilate synthase component I family protein [Candidatus Omnitrophota bacterium]